MKTNPESKTTHNALTAYACVCVFIHVEFNQVVQLLRIRLLETIGYKKIVYFVK